MVNWIELISNIAAAPLHSWTGLIVVAAITVACVRAVHWVGARIMRRVTRPYPILAVVIGAIEWPSLYALAMLAIELVLHEAPDELALIRVARDVGGLTLIGMLTLLAVRSVAGVGDAIVAANPLDTADNLHARRIHTQTRVLARSVMTLIVMLGIASMLMMFPNVRQVGTSLLASAGVAGLVAGIAARPVLANMIAGLQIALSQPIRLDDVVVIQGEWGRIEEITGTYVAIRIWDQRRLIVPLQWLIENPFTNWTRNSSQIIGTVFLFVDYKMPLPPLREELSRIVNNAPEWDGRVQVLQVTDATDHAMQLRVLVSSSDSGLNWDLRCRVREGLIAFIQRYYPECLPKMRADLSTERERALQAEPQPMREATPPEASKTVAHTEADPVAMRRDG
ncbi:Mechanosensitive ion channel [Mycetohabitans rhizoxinica HKI 454]|uniref:Mechanosensitive ion channel n=1 Tax=Mycetohabitans rhizoxinica (strain DSM 19002 / CIP 109453 / HKI 454) TaxID=882378 RepID=E5ARC6_MYCRK|nr:MULTISPECIES: mechanosensitive ion channel domain-containing protein [unclassified Mycetohabitans]CBW75158.1 Mechanosensitive ion channel [Mycetohabitans rhizoxinica HKI 454]